MTYRALDVAASFPFPFLGSGVAAYYKSASLLIWFERAADPAVLDEWPDAARHEVRGPVLVIETDDDLDLRLTDDAAWQTWADATAAALRRIHARAPIAFAAKEFADEGGMTPDAWHAWSVKQAPAIVARVGAKAIDPQTAALALPYVVPYLPRAAYGALRDAMLARLAPLVAKPGGRDVLELWSRFVQGLPVARRRALVATLHPAVAIAYALESEFALDDVLALGIARRAAKGAKADVRRLVDRLVEIAIASPPRKRAHRDAALAAAGACLAACTDAQRAMILAAQGDFDGAIAALETADADDDRYSRSVGVVLALATQRSHRAAIAACNALLADSEELVENPIAVANMLGEMLGTSRFAEAAALARSHLEAGRGMTAVLHTNAILAFAQAREIGVVAQREAARIAELLGDDDGSSFIDGGDLRGSAHAWLAQWYVVADQPGRAVKHLRHAATLEYADLSIALMSPQFAPIANRPEIKAMREAATTTAVKAKSKTIAKNDHDWWAIFSRGLMRHNAGDVKRALVDYERVLELNPDYPDVYINIGNIHWTRDKDIPTAIRWYDRALALAGRQVTGRLNRAEARLLVGDPRGALDDATIALDVEPRSAHGLCLRALAHLRLGDRRAAIADGRAATKLDRARSTIDNAELKAELDALLTTP
jgi:tetratricopeptide (TPR) repeat protein